MRGVRDRVRVLVVLAGLSSGAGAALADAPQPGADVASAGAAQSEWAREEWKAEYEGDNSSAGVALEMDPLGNVYVTGYEGYDGYVTIKYDPEGNEMWSAVYDGRAPGATRASFPVALALGEAGEVCVTGCVIGDDLEDDIATIQYDAEGTFLWAARYGRTPGGWDRPEDMAMDDAGSAHVTGWSESADGDLDIVTIRYDSDGNEVWVALYDGPTGGDDQGNAIALDGAGNVYVTGSSGDPRVSGEPMDACITTLKYDARGSLLWVARYDGPGAEEGGDGGTAIALDAMGAVYVTGASEGADTGLDYVTIKYDGEGKEVWVARYDGIHGLGDDVPSALALDGAGAVHVTGASAVGGCRGVPWWWTNDIVTLKYDAEGTLLWKALYDGPGQGGHDSACDLELDAWGNVYVSGFSDSWGGGDDYTTIKYDASGVQRWVARHHGEGDWHYDDSRVNDMAVDGEGNVYVTGREGSRGLTIKYEQLRGRPPLDPDEIDGAGDVGESSSMAIDPSGQAHICYQDATNGALKHATNASGRWETRGLTAAGEVGLGSSLVLDDAGHIHASYYETTGIALKYGTDASGEWVSRTVWTRPPCASRVRCDNTSLALDAQGNAHMAFLLAEPEDGVGSAVGYASNRTGEWVVTSIDGATEQRSCSGASLTLDRGGHVHLSYGCEDDVGMYLMHATNESGAWVASRVDQQQPMVIKSFPGQTSIAVDDADGLHIAYGHQYRMAGMYYREVLYATDTTGEWETESVLRTYGEIQPVASVAVDGSGAAYLAFFNEDFYLEDGYSGIVYAENGDGAWTVHEVHPSGGASPCHPPSIALDGDREVHISYYDATDGGLRYFTTRPAPPFELLVPDEGAAEAEAPLLAWQRSDREAFYVVWLFDYAGLGYRLMGFWTDDDHVRIPDFWWRFMSPDRPQYWLVLAYDADSNSMESSETRWFYKTTTDRSTPEQTTLGR